MKRRLLAIALIVFAVTASAETKTRNVAIFLYDGVEVLDFTGPAEVIEASSQFVRQENPAVHLFTVARTKEPLLAQRFLKITPDYSIEDAPKIDVLVIPGGNSGPTTKDAAAMEWIRKTVDNAEVTLTVCTGAFPLAKLGYFDGRTVTTWYGAIAALRQAAPKATVEDGRRYVDNEKFITTAGVSAGIDGALHLVARLFGRRVADQTAQYMEYHWTPEPYLARAYPYLNPSTDERGRLAQLADMHRQEKNFAAAVEIFRRLADEKADDYSAWYQLGRTLQQSGDQAAAIPAFQRALPSTTLKQYALYNIACAYGVMKNREQALSYIEQAIDAGFRGDFLSDPDLAILKEEPRTASLATRAASR